MGSKINLKNKSKLPLRWAYLVWMGLIISSLMIGLIGALVQGDPEPFILGTLGFGDMGIFALGSYGFGLLLGVILLIKNLKAKGLNWEILGLKGKVSHTSIVYILFFLVFDSLVLFPIATWAFNQLGIDFFWGGDDFLNFTSILDWLVVSLSALMIAPIAEEILFRGYLLNALIMRGHNLTWAVIVSILAFSSVHIFFGPGFIFYIIIWALIPTYLSIKFKSLYPAIVYHTLNNILSYLIIPLF